MSNAELNQYLENIAKLIEATGDDKDYADMNEMLDDVARRMVNDGWAVVSRIQNGREAYITS